MDMINPGFRNPELLFEVTGPYNLDWIRAPNQARVLDVDAYHRNWKEGDLSPLNERVGVYVFGIHWSNGITPYYVGLTCNKDGFGSTLNARCRKGDELFILNSMLSNVQVTHRARAQPCVFLISAPVRRGRNPRSEIRECEGLIQQLARAVNPRLLNKNQSSLPANPRWGLKGISAYGGDGRKASKSTRSFCKMMNIN